LTLGYDRANVDDGIYKGEIIYDRYDRALPKSAHGTANLGAASSSTRKIMAAVMELYDRIADKNLRVRRVTLLQ
jgi:DNA polymerase V